LGSSTTLTVTGANASNTFGGVISGSGALKVTGGTLTLSGNNTFSGGEAVSNGAILSIAANANLGAIPASATPASITLNGGTLRVTANTAFEAATISGNRGITLGASGGTIQVTAVGNNTVAAFGNGETAVQYDGIIAGSGNLSITGGGGTNSGTAPYLLELGGTASQTTYNTYTGNTTVNNATLAFQNVAGNLNATNLLPATTVLNLINNGWFVMNSGAAKQTIAGLTGDSTGLVDNASGTNPSTLIIAPAASTTYTFSGGISGNTTFLGKTGTATEMSVIINGSGNGTEIFTGTSNYAGGTTVGGGVLYADNATSSLGSGNVTVNSGGTLSGNGSTGTGAVTINAGGTLAAGLNAITAGILHTDLTVNGNATITSRVFGVTGSPNPTPGTDFDQIVDSAGTTTLGASTSSPINVRLTLPNGNATAGFSSTSNYSFPVLTFNAVNFPNDGAAGTPGTGITVLATDNGSGAPTVNPTYASLFTLDTSAFANSSLGTASNGSFALELNIAAGGSGDLEVDYAYSAAPEPGTAMLVLAGGLPMLMARRRRRNGNAATAN
jgi:autotransporter-associated beta strand protein